MTKTFDPYDPGFHQREMQRVARRIARERRDQGWSSGEILRDPQYRYFHDRAFTYEAMCNAHARTIVDSVMGEPGDKLRNKTYAVKVPLSQVPGEEVASDAATVQGAFVWERAHEDKIVVDPLLQAAVIRTRIELLTAQIENLPRKGLRFRRVRATLVQLREELDRLTS